MPGAKRNVPEIVEHVVSALIKKGYPRKSAWAIGIKHLQDTGILKKGSIDLTNKGKSANSKHIREPKSVRMKKIKLAKGKSK